MNDQEKIFQSLGNVGLSNEKGWERGGLYSPEDVVQKADKLGLTRAMVPVARLMAQYSSASRMHEFLHCFDVALGSVELLKQLQEAGVNPQDYAPQNPQDAFMAGIFHDLVLGLTQSGLENAVSVEALNALVGAEHRVSADSTIYIKGPVEDDLYGTVLLDITGLGDNANLKKTVISAADHGKLVVPVTQATLLQKVLDAIWYHDGNAPIRGHAEAEMLVGDRIDLYEQRRVDAAVVEQGIGKLLGYTVIEDDSWVERSTRTDPDYLHKMVEKKAPGFMQAVQGTRAYDFMVEDLVPRGRSMRTLTSPAFLAGVAKMSGVVRRLEQNPELKAQFGKQIDTLYQRHEQAQQIIGAYK